MNFTTFLDSFFDQIQKVGLDISGLPLDHLAYQASTSQEYGKLIDEFKSLGNLVSEEIIGERRVAVFELLNPITYKNYSVPALELIEPKTGQVCKSEFQHAEFVIYKSFQDYLDQYPQINWDTSSMDRAEFSHLKINFENGLTVKLTQAPILEKVKEK